MHTYKLQNPVGDLIPATVLRSDGSIIPFNPANTDYQEYLKWLSEGNQPIPADEE